MSGKPRIACFTIAYPPIGEHIGGAEIALREMALRLKHKYNFSIITTQFRPGLQKIEHREEGKVVRVGTGWMPLDKLVFPWLASRSAEKEKPELVFCLMESYAAYAGISYYHRNPQTPAVLNSQSGDTEEYIRGKLWPFGFLHNKAYSKHFNYAVISNFLRERTLSHGIKKEQIYLIPNGVDTKLFSRSKNKAASDALRKKFGIGKKKVILTVSRLTMKNAVDDCIKAMRKVDDAVLLIAGTGEDEAKLKELCHGLGLNDKVIFAGHVPYDKLPSYYSLADVFVRPSISEGFGNSFIEALSCETPIIGTKVGGIPDFLTEAKTGLFCAVRNPDSLAKQIRRLLSDKALHRKIAAAGKRLVQQRYTWDAVAASYDKLFKRLLE